MAKQRYPKRPVTTSSRLISDTQLEAKAAGGNDGFSNSAYVLVSGYDGANTSPRRGMIYWPTTNTKHEANKMTRAEIRRRVHWLYANNGTARRLVNGAARLIGYLTPQPDTLDEDWNQLAFEHFMERAGSPTWFDRSGKFDFFEGQLQLERTAGKDGFCLPILTSGSSGGMQLAFYESYQLQSPPAAGKEWSDGVRLDDHHAHLAYGVRRGSDDRDVQIIDAADAIYYGRFESWGETHPMSILAAAVNDLIDVVEVRADTKHAIKTAAQIGMVTETESNAPASAGAGGIGGPRYTTLETKPDGTTQEVTWQVVTSGGRTPDLEPGRKLKVVHDDRPGPNSREFERDLIKSCAAVIDLPYEALFEIAGVAGPGIRYWMADIRRWVLVRHLARARWCQRYYAAFMAREIQLGRLRAPTDKRFWRAMWFGMADPTIDEARKGQLSIVELGAGLTTWADEWGEYGAFWKTKIRQRVREVAFAKRECLQATRENAADGITVTYEECFADRRAPVQQATAPEPDSATNNR